MSFQAVSIDSKFRGGMAKPIPVFVWSQAGWNLSGSVIIILITTDINDIVVDQRGSESRTAMGPIVRSYE